MADVPPVDALDLSEAGLNRTILQLAVPAVVENVLVTAVFVANTVLIGWLRDENALAAVSLAGVGMWIADALFSAIAVGATAVVARAFGARDRLLAERAAAQAILLAWGSAITLGVLLWAGAPFLLKLMGATPEVGLLGTAYMRLIVSTSLIAFPLTVLNGIMRGAGDTRTPMLITLIMNSCNVLTAYLLIFGVGPLPALGVVGAGAATGIARGIGGLLALLVLLRGYTLLRVRPGAFGNADLDMMRTIVRLATPAAGELFVQRAGWAIFARIIASLGTLSLAAHQIAVSVESLSFMPGFGFSVAATTLVGQSLGAHRSELAEESVSRITRYALLAMGTMGVLFATGGPTLVRAFGATPELLSLAGMAVRISALEQLPLAAQMVLAGALRGAGDTRSPLITSLVGLFAFRITAVYILAVFLGLGLAGAWYATAVDWTSRALIIYFLYRRGHWKQIRL